MDPRFLALAIAALLIAGYTSASADDREQEPRDSGLVEEAERRLVQLDVIVRGPADTIAGLTGGDLQLTVGGRPIDEFELDRVCVDSPPAAAQPGTLRAPDAEPVVPAAGLSLLFYFDEYHLTFDGRRRSIALSRTLIQELIGGNHRAMVVSGGREILVFSDWTSDRTRLLDALDRLANEASQVDSYASQEESRVRQVFAQLNLGLDTGAAQEQRLRSEEQKAIQEMVMREAAAPTLGTTDGEEWLKAKQSAKAFRDERNLVRGISVNHARASARQYQQEESRHAERGLARLSMALDYLNEVNRPKAVVYFGDTLRSNPGDHFLTLLNPDDGYAEGLWQPTDRVVHGANSSGYETVINDAAMRGVRVYTVQAQGLVLGVSMMGTTSRGLSSLSKNPMAGSRRFDDAKNGLAGLALETGGQVFLGANTADRIAERLREDLACQFVLSFDPRDLPRDRALQVLLTVNRPGVEALTRTRLFVQSESARMRSRLSAAFVASDAVGSDKSIRAVVIPTGYDNRRYSALVQVAVAGADLPSATWDLGLTLVAGGRVRQEASGRVSIDRPGVPIVLETVMSFAPGPFEVTAVGHETRTDRLLTTKIEGAWPDPKEGLVTVGPIALLQPAAAVFVRDEERRLEGSMGYGAGDWVRTDRPTALVGIVCRGRSKKDVLTVQRRLSGEGSTDFPPLNLELGASPCAVFSDLIEAQVMDTGRFAYEVLVSDPRGEITTSSRELIALSPEDLP